MKALGSTENVFDTIRPNDLFRDIIRKIVKILLKENILSLHVQSALNKLMTEFDRQLPKLFSRFQTLDILRKGE